VVRERTGLVLDPDFSAAKMEWLLRNVEGLSERASTGRAVFGTVDAWLVFSLSGEAIPDPSNASRMLLIAMRARNLGPRAAGCLRFT
jgi:glycerol kinase